MGNPTTVSFHTLGCKLNFSETSSIKRQFEGAGYGVVDGGEPADIFIINTCSVTDFADRKCRQVIRRAMRINPDAKVVVTGCYAQLKPQEIANIPGVDLVLGAKEKFQALNFIDQLKAPGKGLVKADKIEEHTEFTTSFSFGDRTRSFLKIQDGCNYNCSFCTIPKARGRSRNDSIEAIVENAHSLADSGVTEIVLTGVNIGDFNDHAQRPKETSQAGKFIDLISALDKVEGIKRFRISSIEPNLCSNEIIEFVAESKRFVPHFHMPLQSGNNKQLAEMRRRYKRELYKDRVEYIKSLMPHCCIGVDVIVGFPGETDVDFIETHKFIEALPVSYLHVFTYSERANTNAISLDGVVDMRVRRMRNQRLRILSEKKKNAFYKEHIGEIRPVLFEVSGQDGTATGFTDNYIKISLPTSLNIENEIHFCKLKELMQDGLMMAKMATEENYLLQQKALSFKQTVNA